MADLEVQPGWPAARQLDRDEFASGGPDGNLNEHAKVFLARTEFLNQQKANKSEIVQGQYSFATLTAFNAVKATIPANSTVIIEEAGANQGTNTWNGTTLTKSIYDPQTQANNRMDANPLFKVRDLTTGEDLNNIIDGIYRVNNSTVGDTLLNLPGDLSPKIGTLFAYRKATTNSGIAYQKFIKYTGSSNIEMWERTGNGGTGSFAWYPWVKAVSRYDYDQNNTSITASITAMGNAKAEINIFPNTALTSDGSYHYQATLAAEGGYPTVTVNTGGVTLVSYDALLSEPVIGIGRTVTFTAQGFSNVTSSLSGDITIQALDAAGVVIATSSNAYIQSANTWSNLSTSLVIPAGTAKLRYRMINRNGTGNTVCKFRNAAVVTDYVLLKQINTLKVPTVQQIYYVAKTGSDSNNGTSSSTPFLTIQKAVDSLPQGGIIEVAGGEYRETITVSTNANLWIRSKRDQRAKILGSDQLVVTKTAGYTQVYQAPLAAKPVGMGGGRGQPVIFEWGTPSKPINEAERHFLHRGHTHRLPYAEMFEAASLAELDTAGGRGKWWWDAGIIYFAATDGSDATLKRYEARVRPCLIQSNGSIQLTRIDAWFSNSYGMIFSGVHVKRADCRAFGSYHNGFADNANFTESYRDESAGNGNDGFNGTVTGYADATDETTRLESVYFDPYGHDNGDDGLSDHYRGDVTIYGGLFEYNTKADVVHVTGANCVCYNTEARGTLNGFYAATATTGDASRVKTTFKCVGTKATGNTYGYRAADDAVLNCENAKAINSTGYGYYQTGVGAINAVDCKYTGDPAKMKSGTVNVTNHNALN